MMPAPIRIKDIRAILKCDHEWEDIEDRSDPAMHTILGLKGQAVEKAQRCARCGQIQIIPIAEMGR